MSKPIYTDNLGGTCEAIENSIEHAGNIAEQKYERSELRLRHRKNLEKFMGVMEKTRAPQHGFSGTYVTVAAELQKF